MLAAYPISIGHVREEQTKMKQSLEKKQRTRIIIFTLLLTMLAWLAPANIGVVKAADNRSTSMSQSNNLKVSKKSKEPLYKQCARKSYASKYKLNKDFVCVKLGEVSGKKIKLYLGCGIWDTGEFYGTRAITGTIKGKTIKFKTSKWYYGDQYGVHSRSKTVSGTVVLINKNTVKLKIKSGKAGLRNSSFLKPGKTITLRYSLDTKDIFQEL